MFQESSMIKIKAVVGIMIVIALASYAYYNVSQVQYMYHSPVTISVTGEGEVSVKPDIATFSFTVNAKEATAVAAQNKANETMDKVLAYIKESGVEEKDITTSFYNLNPRYEYPQVTCTEWGCPPQPQAEPKLIGYEVSQAVTIKVRDMNKAGEIVAGVGSKGAQNVNGPSFSIDDINKYENEARDKAIADGQEQAKVIAHNLGKRLGRVTGYWEDPASYQQYGMETGSFDMMKSYSAAPEMSSSAQIPAGESTITGKVNISYELR